MGVLYYFEREDDKRTFALNKVYSYAPNWITRYEEWRDPPTTIETCAEFRGNIQEWARRVQGRLETWAEGHRIRCISENHYDIYEPDLTCEEEEARITGSAHDSGYKADGVTYIKGSAW